MGYIIGDFLLGRVHHLQFLLIQLAKSIDAPIDIIEVEEGPGVIVRSELKQEDGVAFVGFSGNLLVLVGVVVHFQN